MDKQAKIVEMFDEIAPSYDLANRILSFGVDVQWRKEGCLKAIERLGSKENLRVADVACGTGDMILHWQRYLLQSTFIGIDPSSKMLDVAKQKVKNSTFIQAQAQELPLENESVDVVSIAYGLRNVCDYPKALQEFYRVLKKGGVLLILEFTHNANPNLLDKIALFYTQKILPRIGGWISKNPKAYRYLPDSIETFATLDQLKQDLYQSGFSEVFAKSYSAKLSSIFVASKE